MTESIKTDIVQQKIFISNLIEVTRKKDKELKKFIDDNLFPRRSSLSIEAINDNINALKKMDKNEQLLVRGRAKHFEESNDPSKYFPILIAIIGIIISLYGMLRDLSDTFITFIINVLVIVFMVLFTTKLFTNTIEYRSTAIYFNSLITNMQYDENEKTS
ncbi:hypothetical protein ACQKOF_19855 [Lysinibacillus sp. NPDC093190]|uniref:hypothetical protein n=1 Tax=Lysinibacillus sp. NPDC093190 TaxID=3390575 RepID=UPI003D0375E4